MYGEFLGVRPQTSYYTPFFLIDHLVAHMHSQKNTGITATNLKDSYQF